MDLDLLTERLGKRTYFSLLEFCLPWSSAQHFGRETTTELDQLFFSCFGKLGVKTLVECGANEASASLEATNRGIKAIAIEANPHTFSEVTPQTREGLTAINIGLSDTAGKIDFYVPKTVRTAGSSTFVPKPGVDYDTVEVPTRPLDDLMAEHDVTGHPFALWIDVEGLQKQVLAGAENTLGNPVCKLVKIEVENKEIFGGQEWFAQDVDAFMQSHGFIPVFRDFEYLNQFNILYIKGDDADVVADMIAASTDKVTKCRLTLSTVRTVLRKKQDFLSEAKSIALKLIGRSREAR